VRTRADADTATDAVDPRIERTRLVVRQAALDELGDIGYGAFTIESVAARAGVAKSTIYRHWPDKLALIADAFETSHEQMVPHIETAVARERVTILIRHVAEVLVDSTFSRCIPALIEGAARDSRLRKFLDRYSAERRRSLTAAIEEGVASGEFREDIDADLAAQALLGTIFYRRLVSEQPLEPTRADDLVATVLGPIRRRRRTR
jgi:AcrR family transcriptional regulator